MSTPPKPQRQESNLQDGGVVMEKNVHLTSCDKLYFAVIAKFTVVLTVTSLIAAVFVLINIQQYYKVAYEEVGTTLIASVAAQVRSDVSKFFVPKFNIRSVFQFTIATGQINTQDVWTKDPGQALSRAMAQYSDIMAPIFYSDGDFLAAYQAFDNRQVLKYAGEIPDQWFTEHRHYVNASYQERLRCSVTRESWDNPRNCEMAPPNVKSYDPFEKGWYISANATNGRCLSNCKDGFDWVGPGFQSALAEGDTDKPVFEMLFHLDWPSGQVPGATGTKHYSNFKVKFLIDKLKDVVDAVDVGKSGDVAIVNAEGEILAAQSLDAGGIQIKDADGEKAFKKIWALEAFANVEKKHLGQPEKVIVQDEGEYFVIANPIEEVPGWTVVVFMEVDDFLPVSSQKVNTAGALSILSIVLTTVRTVLLLMTWGGQWYFVHRSRQRVAPQDVQSSKEISIVQNASVPVTVVTD